VTAGRAAVLAIDGGNSKTDVALVAADGTLLASARGPGSNAHIIGLDQAMAVIGQLATAAARQAALAADGALVAGGSPVAGSAPLAGGVQIAEHVSACLAGADLAEDEERLGAALRAQGWALTCSVVNDTFAILRAGLVPGLAAAAGGPARAGGGDGAAGRGTAADGAAGRDVRTAARRDGQVRHWGVAVTCGAGINCVAVAPDGREARFPALGPVTGDWGGGEGLGREALWWAVRDEDGRGPQTMLREAVAVYFGMPTASDVGIGIHYGKIPADELLGLAPVLLRTAADGDEVARKVVTRLADEIVAMAVAMIRRLDLPGRAVPVILGGGMLTARDPMLTDGIAAGLAARAPGAFLHIVDVPAVAGAALLGLDHVGAPVSAEERLRAAYLSPAT
jgi:N-acetylglucosamine kinase-like BadF-type ATPase